MKFLGIIPARYASTRFPGKPLADIGGKSMIQRVYEQVAPCLDDVWVATDDERIRKAVEGFGGKVVMTSDKHRSGTDRCLEASQKIGGDYDVVINIQGDEPFIRSEQIEALKACFVSSDTRLATLVKPFTEKDGLDALRNPNSPKVVLNIKREAMYFSRSVIPFLRGVPPEEWLSKNCFYKHIGIYAYRRDTLAEIAVLPQSPMELAESLEQLRWIENGYHIQTALTDIENLAVDTPEDLDKIRKYL
ncbi:MAG: 3-deoxy-manno-octulosonate cytidylyltransferase [Bacteroidales bacterium]|nr:3-deoxy-manno-octulosonate cytidylyltransferase [Bacteroidales bacterium]MDD3906935.1 3-deoxy-manno-octulosonate cytidylyltransferase [Bacteroidales bacterium]MDD4712918.1 3-deoxy-manno-octulosonate cytidylyltransferase [Bacteroidales bacterium]